MKSYKFGSDGAEYVFVPRVENRCYICTCLGVAGGLRVMRQTSSGKLFDLIPLTSIELITVPVCDRCWPLMQSGDREELSRRILMGGWLELMHEMQFPSAVGVGVMPYAMQAADIYIMAAIRGSRG